MGRFANAAPPLGGELGWPFFLWLAGLLEGEGTFLRPPPSEPRYPLVSCRMADNDVVARVGSAFGTAVQSTDKGPYKREFGVTIRGFPAVELMSDLRPLMGTRRKAAIDRALESHRSPNYKLTFRMAEEIRAARHAGESVSSVARRFGVARQTIHQILDRRIYRAPVERDWRGPRRRFAGAVAAGTGLTWAELHWLAGWLEGEGNFGKPPPLESENGPRRWDNLRRGRDQGGPTAAESKAVGRRERP